MKSVEVKVIVAEINKLRIEIIDMKIELEMLKADIKAINEINKEEVKLRVVGEMNITEGCNIIKTIENKKNNIENEGKKNSKIANHSKIKKIEPKEIKENKQDKEIVEFKNINRNLKNAFSKKLKKVINSEIRYDTWLKMGVENLTTRDDVYRFLAPNDFTKGIIESRYREIVEKALKEIFKEVKILEIVVQEHASNIV